MTILCKVEQPGAFWGALGTRIDEDRKMTTEDYLRRTSGALKGNDPTEVGGTNIFEPAGTILSFDQDSINASLFGYADTDNNGYIDSDEYDALYFQAVKGEKPKKLSQLGQIGAGVAAGISLSEKLFNRSIVSELEEQSNGLTVSEALTISKLIGMDADANIDENGDNMLNRDEFNEAAINYILTNSEFFNK